MKKYFSIFLFCACGLIACAQQPVDSIAGRVGIEEYFPLQQGDIYNYYLAEAIDKSPKEISMEYIGSRTTEGGGIIQAQFICKGMNIPQGDIAERDTILFEITPEELRRVSEISIDDEIILKRKNSSDILTWEKSAGYQKKLHTYVYLQSMMNEYSWKDGILKEVIKVSVEETIDATKSGGDKSTIEYYFIYARDIGLVEFKTKTGNVYKLFAIQKH